MTAREFIRARREQANRYSAFVVSGPLLVLSMHGQTKPRYLALAFAVLICWAAAYMVDIRRTPCLICSIPLGEAATAAADEPPRVDRCPHCGGELDRELSGLVPSPGLEPG